MGERTGSFGPINDRKFCSQNLQKFLKGWGANRHALDRAAKDDLTEKGWGANRRALGH